MLTFKSAIEEMRDGIAPVNDARAEGRKPKKTVAYTNESPRADQSCAICEMYTAGRCSAVYPPDVSPRGWCNLFELERQWAERQCTRSEWARTDDALVNTILALARKNIDNPVINRSMKTPYGAGGSVPLADPVTFIDPTVPRTLEASGVRYDPADPWVVHENIEQTAMELLIDANVDPELAYRYCHYCIANVAEDAWKEAHGIDPKAADAVEFPILDRLRSQQIGATNENPRLYLKPYPHDREDLARHEPGGEFYPTPEEIKYCRESLCAILAIEGEAGEMIRPTPQLEKAIPGAMIKGDPSVGDAHVPTVIGNDRKKPKDPRRAQSFRDLIATAYYQGRQKRFEVRITKADEDKKQIFGWASVCTVDGVAIVDKQDDIIPVEELEDAVYEFTQYSRDMGNMHQQLGTGRMIESVVCTKEKAAVGLRAFDENGKPIEAWWVGFHVVDPASWAQFKAGERPELSIGGRASWEEA